MARACVAIEQYRWLAANVFSSAHGIGRGTLLRTHCTTHGQGPLKTLQAMSRQPLRGCGYFFLKKTFMIKVGTLVWFLSCSDPKDVVILSVG